MKILVCGSRGKSFNKEVVYKLLRKYNVGPADTIIEGCCPNSADVIAEEYAKEYGVPIMHFPANSGNYIKRNIEMVDACDAIFAFFDGFSYGTSHSIAQGVMKEKKVVVVDVSQNRKI